jgi:Heavy metal associated domain 2
MSYYIADTPGRLRIESPVLKGDGLQVAKFRDLILGIPGVSSVEMKPIIGSATILYHTDKIDHTKLIESLEKSGCFDHLHAKTPDDLLEEGIEKVTEVAVDALKGTL